MYHFGLLLRWLPIELKRTNPTIKMAEKRKISNAYRVYDADIPGPMSYNHTNIQEYKAQGVPEPAASHRPETAYRRRTTVLKINHENAQITFRQADNQQHENQTQNAQLQIAENGRCHLSQLEIISRYREFFLINKGERDGHN